MHAGTSRVENFAQGSSCQLKFVHGMCRLLDLGDMFKYSYKFHNIIIAERAIYFSSFV